jgi:hypothetical protein
LWALNLVLKDVGDKFGGSWGNVLMCLGWVAGIGKLILLGQIVLIMLEGIGSMYMWNGVEVTGFFRYDYT